MSPKQKPLLRIAAVAGSLRPGSYSSYALDIALAPLRQKKGVEVDLIDPRALEIGFPGTQPGLALEAMLTARLERASGVILCTPEYHGSFSSILKALIDCMGYPSVLADKPIALIGVAGGRLGAVKALEHLRSVCSHVGALVLPYPVSIAEVHAHISPSGACDDPQLVAQLQAAGEQLLDYLEGHYHLHASMEELVREDTSE